ncbi:MAG: endonuclease/exonuclease/phosphatase family protein [Candidatus Kariarchaeaceae archaeon]|jgi:maltose 6'-phosphate phosphatase
MKFAGLLGIYLIISVSVFHLSANGSNNMENNDSLTGLNDNLYKQYSNEFLVLTLNLHTYQESAQEEKFDMIVETIGKLDIDIIAFQEAAQHVDSDLLYSNIKTTNMVQIIADRLKNRFNVSYDFVWDWSHYGWQVWEEGVAILSKYPIQHSSNLYVSSTTSTSNIQSRKIISGQVSIPNIGVINLISVHLSWRLSETSEEQNNQIKATKNHVNDLENSHSGYSIVAGDFNGNPIDDPPWNEGYHTMLYDSIYIDSYREAHQDANTKPRNASHDTVKGTFPGRIDYIFRKNDSQIETRASHIIFTPDIIGQVSDHYGVVTKFANVSAQAIPLLTDSTNTIPKTSIVSTSTASSIDTTTSSINDTFVSRSESNKTPSLFPIFLIFVIPITKSLRYIFKRRF